MNSALLLLCLVGTAIAAPLAERAVNDEGCGVAKVSLQRIVGGSNAQKGQYPWIASLRFRQSTTSAFRHTCGCSIIDDQWILVAAHCFINSNNPSSYAVRVATYNQTAGSTEPEAVEIAVEKIVKHPQFSMSFKISHDIGLMKLKSKVDFSSPYVNRVCLPPSASYNTDNQNLTVSGWGDTVNGQGRNIPQLLKHTALTAQTDAACKKSWGSFMWTDGQMLCATAPKTSPCVGDSGGPLMALEASGKRVQVGVVSFGDSSCAGPRPPVFTRVSHYVDWIKTTMAAN